MIRINLLIVVIFYCFTTKSQNLILEKITSYPSLKFDDYYNNQFSYHFRGDTLFLIDGFNITVANANSKIKILDLNKLLTKDLKNKIDKRYSYEYYFKGSYLIVKNRGNIFVFTYLNNEFAFQRSYFLSRKYGNNIYIYGDKIILSELYNHHPKSECFSSGYLELDLNAGTEKMTNLEFKYIGLTHFGSNKFLDFTAKGYLLADPFTYKIYEYDFDNNLRDSLSAPDTAFKVSDNLKYFSDNFSPEKLSDSPASHFSKINDFLSNIDRIWSVNYLNDTTIYVRLARNSLNPPDKKKEMMFDHIWRKSKNHWELIQSKSLIVTTLKNNINRKDLWPDFFLGTKIYFDNGYLYHVIWNATENIFPQKGESFYGFDALDKKNLKLKVLKFKVN
jgi:hypothetical protein